LPPFESHLPGQRSSASVCVLRIKTVSSVRMSYRGNFSSKSCDLTFPSGAVLSLRPLHQSRVLLSRSVPLRFLEALLSVWYPISLENVSRTCLREAASFDRSSSCLTAGGGTARSQLRISSLSPRQWGLSLELSNIWSWHAKLDNINSASHAGRYLGPEFNFSFTYHSLIVPCPEKWVLLSEIQFLLVPERRNDSVCHGNSDWVGTEHAANTLRHIVAPGQCYSTTDVVNHRQPNNV